MEREQWIHGEEEKAAGRKAELQHRAWGQPVWGGAERQCPGLSVPVQEGQGKAAKSNPSRQSRTGRTGWEGQHQHLLMHEDP